MDILLIPIAYLIGSVSFAVVVSKCMRLPDPHSYGSGNPGATNVLRTGNKRAAVLTLLGDVLKGFVAVVLVRMILGEDTLSSSLNSWILCGSVVAVFLGHLFPIFHGFKGGKGVATACVLLIWRHRSNIVNLLNGTESKIGSQSKSSTHFSKRESS